MSETAVCPDCGDAADVEVIDEGPFKAGGQFIRITCEFCGCVNEEEIEGGKFPAWLDRSEEDELGR